MPGTSMRRFASVLGLTFVVLVSFRFAPVLADDDPASPQYYSTRVKPILDQNCARCHGGLNRRGGLSLDTRAAMLQGGHDGAVIVPGDPAKSLLVRLIRHEGPVDDPMPMPPKRPKLADSDIAIVERWVKAGCVMPGQ